MPPVFEFAAPLWLLLLPLPAIAWWLGRRQARDDDHYGALIHPLAGLLGSLQAASRRPGAFPWFWLIGCALLVAALARPQTQDADPADGAPGHNMIFAIDVSGSMRILDYVVDGEALSRLDMLKRALAGFLEQAPRLRAGVVVFADDVMTWVPLTTDLALAAQMVGEIDNSLAGERTALGDAIALSIRRMQAVTEADASRVLVLLTDGVPTAGHIDPESAAELARAAGIRIYTIGLGGDNPAPFPLGRGGEQTIADIPLDEALLRDLAARTDGAYYRITEAPDLLQVLGDIERLERSRVPAGAEMRDWYWLPALAGLALLLLADRRRPDRIAVMR
jgi:Ca-activated chloride channel homolog